MPHNEGVLSPPGRRDNASTLVDLQFAPSGELDEARRATRRTVLFYEIYA